MVDFELMIKALRLAWIPRLLKSGQFNWKAIPDFLFKEYAWYWFSTNLQLSNERLQIPATFLQRHFTILYELKHQYANKGHQDMILYNNKEISIEAKPFFSKNGLVQELERLRTFSTTRGTFFHSLILNLNTT